MRFMDYIANKNGPLKSARISIPEMRKSTEKIVQMVQRQYFSEEIDCLTDGHQVKGHSKLSNLSPVLIEGTIRVGGRIRHAPIPFDAIHLMILPRDHPVSTFIVRYYHEYLGHAGREHVLSTLRQRFWLLQGRTLVRQVLRKCVSCRKRNEAPMQQFMADLPKERLALYLHRCRLLWAFPREARAKRGESVWVPFYLLYKSCGPHGCKFAGDRLLYPSPSKVYFKSWLSKRNMERQCNQFCRC